MVERVGTCRKFERWIGRQSWDRNIERRAGREEREGQAERIDPRHLKDRIMEGVVSADTQ